MLALALPADPPSPPALAAGRCARRSRSRRSSPRASPSRSRSPRPSHATPSTTSSARSSTASARASSTSTTPTSRSTALDFPLMHSVVLLAIFGFVALAAVFIARRPVLAALAVVGGVGWPATIMPGEYPLRTGALALAGRPRDAVPPRGGTSPPRGAGPGRGSSVPWSSSPAVGVHDGGRRQARVPLLAELGPVRPPDDPVGVDYVWNANYQGIAFPEKQTTVLRIKVGAQARALLAGDDARRLHGPDLGREPRRSGEAEESEQIDAVADPLLPEAAGNEENWIRQDVTVEALRDPHLIGSAQPVRWRPGTDAPVQTERRRRRLCRARSAGTSATRSGATRRAEAEPAEPFSRRLPGLAPPLPRVVYQPVPEWCTQPRRMMGASSRTRTTSRWPPTRPLYASPPA